MYKGSVGMDGGMWVYSNMNSDGSNNTAQAAATLQVQGDMDGIFN